MKTSKRVLIVAPHADDEVLGVGGTIARLASEGHDVFVAILTGHGKDEPHPLWPQATWDVVRAEAARAHEMLGVRETIYEEIPAVLVPDQPIWKINEITASVLERVKPDTLFIPFPLDLHRDHRELAYSCSVAWRPSSKVGRNIRHICAYETVSETHWNFPYIEQGFLPNEWVDISSHLDAKLNAIDCFASQMSPFPAARSREAVEALARWRGSQMHMDAAEAFVTLRSLK